MPVFDRLKTSPLRTYEIRLAYFFSATTTTPPIPCSWFALILCVLQFASHHEPDVQVRLALTISPDMEIPVGIYSKTTRYLDTSNQFVLLGANETTMPKVSRTTFMHPWIILSTGDNNCVCLFRNMFVLQIVYIYNITWFVACCGCGRHFCWVFSMYSIKFLLQLLLSIWNYREHDHEFLSSIMNYHQNDHDYFFNMCVCIYVGVTNRSHLIVFFQVWAFHLWRNSPKWQLQLGTLKRQPFSTVVAALVSHHDKSRPFPVRAERLTRSSLIVLILRDLVSNMIQNVSNLFPSTSTVSTSVDDF